MEVNSSNYVELAVRTENQDFDEIRDRLSNETLIRLDHAGHGMSTEAGEFMTAMKRRIFYGKELDTGNLVEEVGDMLWYCAEALAALSITMEECMERNIAKLAARYPEQFTEEDALNRDLSAEGEALAGDKE